MKSMTGYGKGQNGNDLLQLTVEIKSVNSRYQDFNIRVPKELSFLEHPIKQALNRHIHRGNVNVYVNYEESPNASELISVDEQALEKKYNTLKTIREKLNLQDSIKLEHLLEFDDLFTTDFSKLSEEMLIDLLKPALKEALQNHTAMREAEGEQLAEDMRRRIDAVSNVLSKIEANGREDMQKEFDQLFNNVKKLIAEQKIDKDRLQQEVALIAERVDITEEKVRLGSHLQLYRKTMEEQGDIGKKLNFILQEMHREANTINSKTANVNVQHYIINIKEEIEKLREQVQNIE